MTTRKLSNLPLNGFKQTPTSESPFQASMNMNEYEHEYEYERGVWQQQAALTRPTNPQPNPVNDTHQHDLSRRRLLYD